MMVERFSALECAKMFNVDCSPTHKPKGAKVRWVDAPYAFNDCNLPLWTIRKRKVGKRVRPFADSIKPGITTFEPGTKGRVADLARFYDEHAKDEVSAFNV